MADPRRLLEEGASEFEAKLLAAGRKDAPSPVARRRIVWGLGLGGLLPFTIALPAKAEIVAWLQVGARSLLLRSALGGTLGAVAVWTGVTLAQAPPALEARPAPARPAQAVSAPVPLAPSEPPTAFAEAAPVQSSAGANKPALRRNTSGAREDSRLSEELSHLERARRALAGGDAKRTLRLLDDYARAFDRPRLGAEAAVLRVEALVANGQRARATAIARASLARQPNGPYARRLRSLIGDVEEPRKPQP